MMQHPTALIDPTAKVHPTAKIGPYASIGANVTIGENVEIMHHVVVEGPTKIGEGCRIFPFASIGLEPQDKKFHGENSTLVVGRNNTIREYVTMNRGSEAGGGVTQIGDDNWIMAYCHIAHDCILGSNIVMANGTTLGGHVTIGNWVTLGGLTAVHQNCRVGDHALTGGQSMIPQDVAPFTVASGNRAKAAGVNFVGLERRGFTPEQLAEINKIYRIFYLSGLSKDNANLKISEEMPNSKFAKQFIDFVDSSQRGVTR